MALYVQVVNNQMAQCIDTTPPVPVGQDGWKNAVEIKPTPVPYRQGLNGPVYDCSKDPVEIVWTVFDYDIPTRQSSQLGQNTSQYNQVVAGQVALETNANPDDHYDPAVVAAAQARYESLRTQINAATTQEELDVTQAELNS
jgi:hypothetical protein